MIEAIYIGTAILSSAAVALIAARRTVQALDALVRACFDVFQGWGRLCRRRKAAKARRTATKARHRTAR
ncbi:MULTISPECIES: hypothetical protein [unclassified Streptomyces]|uniref:hypothetical protein n=1 Tax=unclassified Streptomyces TaxID=2593676 RepID=UPI00214BD67A|nr:MULTISPECIES: hypothetical protein [unclassified Streptomyces]MCX5613330.1 hypothetical protein [Streptomyces sp. NBC_00047]UUU37764.1 hypothetical protein JIW86_01900 [Streptomyces sp. NBC_00162]